MAETQSLLTLAPVTEDDAERIRSIWARPELSRRHSFAGVRESHPVDWTPRLRTFGVRLDGELFGSISLKRDADEADTWELSIVLAEHLRPLDGARSALAGIAYAFGRLKARAVWFWALRELEDIATFAQVVGFTRLNSLRAPGGEPADVYELNRTAWETSQGGALNMFWNAPVELTTSDWRWRGGFPEE